MECKSSGSGWDPCLSALIQGQSVFHITVTYPGVCGPLSQAHAFTKMSVASFLEGPGQLKFNDLQARFSTDAMGRAGHSSGHYEVSSGNSTVPSISLLWKITVLSSVQRVGKKKKKKQKKKKKKN